MDESVGINREFIGWQQPILVRAVEYLITRYATETECDLSGVVVVLPGRRAGRRLLELLVETTSQQYPDFIPPQIETAGTLPDLLFVNQQQYADTLTCNLIWAESLRSADQRALRDVVPEIPLRDDTDAWLALADLIRGQHRELAAEGLNFEDVAVECRKVGESSESRRWLILRAVQADYLERMDKIGYWDRQTARLEAVKRGECETDRDILLVATVDLNRGIREMLQPIADRVTALVGAPEEYTDHFDEFGTLVSAAWQDNQLPLDSDQVTVVDRPDDQAATAVDAVGTFDGKYRADEITIGVADDRLIPHLQRHFDECNVPTRWFDGQHLDHTPPYRMFEQLAEFIDGLLPGNSEARAWNFEAYSALVRHPDMFNWIEQNFAAPAAQPGRPSRHWLVQLDEYRANHLQPRPGFWLDRSAYSESLELLWTKVGDLVADFAPVGDQGALFPEIGRLDSWVAPIREFIQVVYKSRSFNPDDMADNVAAAAIRRFDEILYGFECVPEAILPDVNAAQAIRMMLSECVGEFVPPPRDDSAIELLGWLELVFDDAPALIVTTFNEQFVPKSVTSDMFLPNQLRQILKLNDNSQRYARDAYAMQVMLASRESLQLIVGRRDDSNDPLAPSRLLFATEPEEIPRRVLEFYPENPEPSALSLRSRLYSDRTKSDFHVPEPVNLEPLESLTVSHFKAYLQCRYRFYLRHVLRLREADDAAREMHPGQFGTIIHDVLDRFGREIDIRDSTDPVVISSFLDSAVDRVVNGKFGKVRTAATNVQVQRIRMRLERFAEWQANWARMGYRIRYAEDSNPEGDADRVNFDIGDDESIYLRGRIDRIDQRGDEWVIFDYKTSDSSKVPEETHNKGKGPDRWIDLQLPLYRHLARALPTDSGQRYKVGYILLPGDLTKVGDKIARWSVDDLAEADEVARNVARNIVARNFWPPAASVEYPDFERICQDAVYDREALV